MVAGCTTGSRLPPSNGTRGPRSHRALPGYASTPRSTGPLPTPVKPTQSSASSSTPQRRGERDLSGARRTARRSRSLATGLALLLAVALVAGTLAIVQRGDANRQATRATDAATLADATQLATLARTLPATQNDLGAAPRRRGAPVEAVDHDRRWPRGRADPPSRRTRAGRALDTPVAYPSLSDDGRLIVTPSNDGNIRIYDFAGGRRSTRCGATVSGRSSRFNSDASLVVTGGIHGKVTIWRVATGKPIGPPIPPGGKVVYACSGGRRDSTP